MTLQDHVFKWSCDFMEGRSSMYETILPDLVATDILVVEMFLIYNLTTHDHTCRRVAYLYEWKLFIVSHHLAKSGGYKSCGSRDTLDLVFHMTLQDRVIKGPCDVMEGISSLYTPNLPSLLPTGIV